MYSRQCTENAKCQVQDSRVGDKDIVYLLHTVIQNADMPNGDDSVTWLLGAPAAYILAPCRGKPFRDVRQSTEQRRDENRKHLRERVCPRLRRK